jgi:hypothetical protein
MRFKIEVMKRVQGSYLGKGSLKIVGVVCFLFVRFVCCVLFVCNFLSEILPSEDMKWRRWRVLTGKPRASPSGECI